ncbi:MAG: glutathione S-transferase family protein, partial [Alphaproteobacteria bacterium]
PNEAPKGKIPFIDDDGARIGDSTFIRAHIERKFGIDLDKALNPEQRAQSWAIERMLEDHLYFALVHLRWMDDANFAKGPAHFFDRAPPGTAQIARDNVRATLHAHGIARHSPDEIAELADRSLKAASAILGDKTYLFGNQPSAVDATALGMVGAILTPFFDGELRDAALRYDNLAAYTERMTRKFFPDQKGAG